jgi:hypothetical protein
MKALKGFVSKGDIISTGLVKSKGLNKETKGDKDRRETRLTRLVKELRSVYLMYLAK